LFVVPSTIIEGLIMDFNLANLFSESLKNITTFYILIYYKIITMYLHYRIINFPYNVFFRIETASGIKQFVVL
jgi:hypothetical protein